MLYYTAVLALLIGTLQISTTASNDKVQIKTIIAQFMEGGDKQDVDLITSTLHPEAQQFFKGPEGLVRLSTPAYLEMVAGKKIGGVTRNLDILDIDITGELATVKAEMKNDAMHFDNYFSLMKVDTSWKIVSIVLHLEMK